MTGMLFGIAFLIAWLELCETSDESVIGELKFVDASGTNLKYLVYYNNISLLPNTSRVDSDTGREDVYRVARH